MGAGAETHLGEEGVEDGGPNIQFEAVLTHYKLASALQNTHVDSPPKVVHKDLPSNKLWVVLVNLQQ